MLEDLDLLLPFERTSSPKLNYCPLQRKGESSKGRRRNNKRRRRRKRGRRRWR